MTKKTMDAEFSDLNFLHDLLNNLPHYIFWKDKTGVFRGCNKLFAQQFGYNNASEVIGKTDDDFPWASNLKNKYVNDDQAIMRTGIAKLNYEEKQKQLDGSIKIVLVSKVPIRNNDNTISGVLGIYTDITERKAMESQLKESKLQAEKSRKKAEETNKLKSEFIADMEHDLRTPCSGIAAMTEILEAKEKNLEKKEILHHIANASARLLKILNSILAFDQVESGTLPIIDKKFQIRQVIDDIFAMEMPSAISKKLKLTVNYDKNVPDVAISDEQRISRVLLNVIGNAVKFTTKGHVAVSVKVPKIIDKHHIVLQVIVEDSGIGIPEDKIRHVYERFVRVNPANKNIYEGTGLGLSLAKRFVEDIKGEIDVESKLGKGSKFTCTFPVKLPLLTDKTITEKKETQKKVTPQQKEKQIKQTKKAGELKQKAKVLLVEDDALTQLVAANLLKESISNNLDIASSGNEAIEFTNKNKYDLIFMDIGLPDIKGYDVTHKIRSAKTSKNRKALIVALTAHDSEKEKQKSFDAGMDYFLNKPLNIEKIETMVHNLLSNKPSPKKTPKQDKTSPKIIDLELGAQLVNRDKKMALEMVQMLAAKLPENLIAIQIAFKDKDFEELDKIVHKLHGGCCYCGVPRLKNAAKTLESVLRSGDSSEQTIKNHYTLLCTEIQAVLTEFKNHHENS